MNRMIAVAVVALGLVGCSKKGPECSSVVAAVNPNTEKVKKATDNKSEKIEDTIKSLNDIAAASESAAADLAKLQLTVPEIQKFSTEYVALCKETAAAAREMAQALATTEAASKATDKAAKDGKQAGEKHDKACAAAAEDADNCKSFNAALAKIDLSKADASESVDAMAKVTFKNEAVKTEGATIVAAFKTHVKAVADSNAAQTKAESAEKKFKAISTKEDASIDTLNKFCQN